MLAYFKAQTWKLPARPIAKKALRTTESAIQTPEPEITKHGSRVTATHTHTHTNLANIKKNCPYAGREGGGE